MNSVAKDRRSILIIEDDPWTRTLLEELLASEAYAVRAASNGEDGLQLAGTILPDAILLDLALPRMSGLEVLRRLKADCATRDVPVVILSAYARLVDPDDAAHAASLIEKPFEIEAVLGAVKHVLAPAVVEEREAVLA